jgi:hypothetical protein
MISWYDDIDYGDTGYPLDQIENINWTVNITWTIFTSSGGTVSSLDYFPRALSKEKAVCSVWGRNIRDCDGGNGRGGQCGLVDEKGLCSRREGNDRD